MNLGAKLNDIVAENNKKLVLNTLRLRGDMSRADLSRLLELSFPAVSANVKLLLDENYIVEIGAGDNARGRKSTLLSFNAKRKFIIGVDLGRFRVRMMLADLLGSEVISAETNNTIDSSDSKNGIDFLKDFVLDVVKKSGQSISDISCIVIGMPGIVKNGISSIGPYSEGSFTQDLVSILKDTFEADVILENCVNLGAVGEQRKGAGINYKNITYIAYGVGLGSAHIIDGNLFTGSTGSAGEIGFMVTDPAYISNKYVKSGSLEQLLSISKIKHYINDNNFNEEIIKLVNNYKTGDDMYARVMFEEIAMNFATMLVNISCVLDPEIIIISGGLGQNLGILFLEQWEKWVGNHIPFPPELVISKLNHTETMLGAVMRGVEHVNEYSV